MILISTFCRIVLKRFSWASFLEAICSLNSIYMLHIKWCALITDPRAMNRRFHHASHTHYTNTHIGISTFPVMLLLVFCRRSLSCWYNVSNMIYLFKRPLWLIIHMQPFTSKNPSTRISHWTVNGVYCTIYMLSLWLIESDWKIAVELMKM